MEYSCYDLFGYYIIKNRNLKEEFILFLQNDQPNREVRKDQISG